MSNLNPGEATASPNTNPVKKRRNLPGNPDPDAEVIALSPKSLMATNRFMCEICNKGFQRDQNLQLHRRGHNLPWKLKQRAREDVIKKKVYICPEVSCVHHIPSRALGDLTGIKKHYSRKHGEKKYKCDKCSKKYAVQSDWRAHSKTCGTKEYRCDCGTIFSRRDSFITHRAFCDALSEESAKSIKGANPASIADSNNSPHPLLFCADQPSSLPKSTSLQSQFPLLMRASECNSTTDQGHRDDQLSLKREQQQFNMRVETQPISIWPDQFSCHEISSSFLPSTYQTSVTSPHLSATALLQKAAEMSATMSRSTQRSNQMAAHTTTSAGSTRTPTLLQEMLKLSCLSSASGLDGSFSESNNSTVMEMGKSSEELTTDFLGLKEIFSMRPSFEDSQQNKRQMN